VKPGDWIWPEQSAFDVHGMGRQGAAALHGAPVVPVLPVQTLPAGVPPQRRANELPESSTKAIGSAPRLDAGGGGQSWLVG